MKLALLAPLALPLVFLPNLGAAATKMAAQDRPSFEDVYVNPQMTRLENCQSATLDVYFNENYLAQHSADYLTDAVSAAAPCDIVSIKIVPILVKDHTTEDAQQAAENAKELGLWLDSFGLRYQTNGPTTQTEFDGMTYNGRTAQIVMDVKPANRS